MKLVSVDGVSLHALDDSTFHAVLDHARGASVVIFTSAACASCRFWKQLLLSYAQQHTETRFYEVDAEENLALTRAYDVFHLPSLFLFVNGHFHSALQCEATLTAFHSEMQRALSAPAEEEP